jgi:broad specificity phosphatase PhoE
MVSHGGTLGMLYLYLFGKQITEENYRAHKPENTALTILEIFKNKPTTVHLFNSISHLT